MSAPSDLSLFFGRFHPLLVHLPIGLILLLVFLEAASCWPKCKQATLNNGLILTLAAPLSILTAVLGWLLSREGGYDQRLLQIHFWTGIATAAVVVIASVLYWLNMRNPYRVFLFSSFGVLMVASHFGGSLTHGSDYLVRYAPGPIKNRFFKTAAKVPVSRPVAASASSWQEQPVFASAIQPILDDKCVACHGPEKSKGGLRLDSFAGAIKGGENGAVIVSGKSADSDLIKRVELPLDDDDHMPPDGKPQPSSDDITLIKWWIDSGASSDEQIARLSPTPIVLRILSERMGAPPAKTNVVTSSNEPQPKPNKEIAELVKRLADELDVPVTFLGQDEPWVLCNAGVAGKRFGDAELRKLSGLGPNLKWLDLASTAVTDAGLAELKPFANLTRLHLERTGITDEGLAQLTSLSHLEYLNLHSTAITDAGLVQLEKIPQLRKLYVWQTKATPAGAQAFTEAKFDKEQVRQWEAEIKRLEALIRDQQITVELGVTNQPTTVAQEPINKECPVSGKPVDSSKTSVFNGKTVAFCCDDCKAKFDKDPTAFLAKLGLASSNPASTESASQKPVNTECPVSGKPVDLAQTSVYKGKTVGFCCADCKAKFDKDPKPFLAKLGLEAAQ